MGLDFVVLNRPDDDSQGNWPGHELDARRADDPSPEVLNALKESYSKEFSPEGIAASAKFRGWPRIVKPDGVVGWVFLPLGIVVAYPPRMLRALAAKREDARRRIPSFDDWRANLIATAPPPVVIDFGPNCPPGGEPNAPAAVQWYGFRGKAVQPDYNSLVRWWHARNHVDLDILFYTEQQYEDAPRAYAGLPDGLGGDVTIADMAALFARMEADCLEAFPELAAAAAEEKPNERRAIGPFPERGLEEAICVLDLELIRGAAQFFAFWQGRGYAIAPDY